MSKTNRLNPDYLAEWHANYRGVIVAFTHCDLSLLEAVDSLRSLGFKDEALKIEMLELQKAKREAQGPALKLVVS